ncbi:thioredoxin [Acetobacterium woodii]|uniref:Thioredoxin n=1 Tax=Acetobacterium woodii (strain ATCC 29683 / DSM 1030 / JCM 2381 / KCTC 1655 / WB1) TaxID=931626 RepID=H6LCF1_ACEWD|nr:thioredoxin [Acetobacterium woodii]AFA50266.1 thioredoxin TrxA2 [Acetobacterium woodii DSM 1030]
MSNEKIININMENFETEILSYNGAVMVDFWADWCGPCKSLAPTIDQIALELGNDMKVCKINVDENQSLAQQFRVMSIPTVVFFKNGEAVNRFVGVREKSEYLDTMKNL